jgi:hypothetical protein
MHSLLISSVINKIITTVLKLAIDSGLKDPVMKG